jgi:di/tricarboxylate transporter
LDDFVAAEMAAEADEEEDQKISTKGWIAIATMLLMVVLFITSEAHKYPVGLVGMVGAAIIVVTGCMSEKEAYQAVDWSTIMIMGGAMGLATAMDKTGAGKIIADTVLGWLGSAATPYSLFIVVTILATVQTQIMSCTGTAAILTPIALFMAKSMGIAPHAIIVGIIMGSNLAMLTPIGSVPSSMAAGAGKYTFMDFVKLGTPLTIILLVMTIALTPIFFPM